MLIRRPPDILPSEITSPRIYAERRVFLRQAVASGLIAAGTPWMAGAAQAGEKLIVTKKMVTTTEKLTRIEDVTGYNNFYEFGSDKRDPVKNAGRLKTRPWSVAVEGEVRRPAVYNLEDLIKPHALEERVYRLRCVEAWSMVIPWVGIPLGDVIKRLEPTSRAKYVEFTTLHDPQQMPGQRPGLLGAGLQWPYVEGLRLDEAMHPLALLAVGLYGEVLPNQNGAPLRLVVPWKYGFKSIKSIVKIRLVEREPRTTWNKSSPNEYGFYANVNPDVDHPRWSQAYERRIGEGGLFAPKKKTLPFNGYVEQVASLYSGMDLRKFY